jgi:Mce-associated membrane protein
LVDEHPGDQGRPARRRASRAAGPVGQQPAGEDGTPSSVVVLDAPRPAPARPITTPRRPAQRRAHRGLVATLAVGIVLLLCGAIGGGVAYLAVQQRDEQAALSRDQRFVDTASQLAVNMFSYTQDTIDESVNRFVDSTSGPLRDMLSQSGNVDNLKAIFRDTNASSEAVINGAALEKVDDISGNAEVLVSVRVTVTDVDGTNKPSQPYRLRITVHEDDNGRMSGYDLHYPNGGN